MENPKLVCAVLSFILFILLGGLSIYHKEHIADHVCFCNCDESVPLPIQFHDMKIDCSQQSSAPPSYKGVTNTEQPANVGKNSASKRLQAVLQMTVNAKKNIMRLKYGDADADISTAIKNIIGVIKSVSPEKAEELLATLAPENPKVESSKIVCQEEFIPGKGFQTANCSDVKPIKEVVSILLNAMSVSQSENLVNVLKGIEENYPGMTVNIAAKEGSLKNMTFDLNINLMTESKGSTAAVWLALLDKTTTEYVLIGHNLAGFDCSANLEKSIRIAHTYGYDAVGGSIRDADGHWRLGCQQLTYMNYTLKYKNGYYKSQNSCVVCDHIFSPFVAKAQLIKGVNMADNVHEGMLFEDFFIRMKRQQKKVLNCPEIMYQVVVRKPEEDYRDAWLSLVKERRLNRIYLADGRGYRFSCGDAGISCSLSKSIAIPPCCMEHLQYSIRDLFKECERQDLMIELNCGQIVGAVKLAGVLPWEKDGDVLYLTEQHQKMGTLASKMRSLGYSWGESTPRPGCCWLQTKKWTNGYYALRSSIWRTEVYGRGELPTQFLKQLGLIPTKTLIDGEWLQSPSNPAFFARNRYAHEVFRHQEHYFDVAGLGGGFAEYRPGKLNTCTSPDNQACLDQLHADGNIQFKLEIL